ncbi:MAG: ABC transporter ATP-binding protein [Geminicoccus sp.]|nr:ABC transporter ATP-binding protein [Geminicoccus sp.]
MSSLTVQNLSVAYGSHPALNDVNLAVAPGEIVVILGANGAGKSSLLRAIGGICEGKVGGQRTLGGQSLNTLSADLILESGIAIVPEGRGIFGDLTVAENLSLGGSAKRARAAEEENLRRVLELFPKLQERQNQVARTMSGGEQQMVAIGRAMMSNPTILMLDEPSLGLSPLLSKELFAALKKVREIGLGVLLVEQNAKQSLAIADRGYLLENTRITHEATASDLAQDPRVQSAYLGGDTSKPKTVAAEPVAEEAAQKPDTKAHLPFIRPGYHPSRASADSLISGSIDDLVTNAADVSTKESSTPSTTTTSAPSPAPAPRASSEIERVVTDIEQAARQASERVRTYKPRALVSSIRANNSPSTPAERTEQNREHSEEPVVIEVYRAPRVDVYKRRPSGSFERD